MPEYGSRELKEAIGLKEVQTSKGNMTKDIGS